MRLWPRRRWKRIALAVTVLAVGGVVGYFAVRAWRFAEFEAELQTVIAETDRVDPGWRWEELEAKRPQIPDDENAALVAAELSAWWSQASGEKGDRRVYLWGGPWQLPPNCRLLPWEVQSLRRCLERAAPALELARSLKRYPRGRYPVPLTPDVLSTLLPPDPRKAGRKGQAMVARGVPSSLLPHLDGYRIAVSLLAADMILSLEEGARSEAWERLQTLTHVCELIGGEPFLNSEFVHLALLGEAVESVERWLGQDAAGGEADAGDRLRTLQQFLDQQRSESWIARGLRWERAAAHVLYTHLETGKLSLRPDLGKGSTPEPPLRDSLHEHHHAPDLLHNHAAHLRFMNEMIEIVRLPHHKQPERFMSFCVRLRAEKSFENLVHTMIFPTVDRVVQRGVEQRTVALLDCARCGIACELFRLEHGRWPEALSELVPHYLPEVPTDTYDGEPLRFRRLEDGVVVYSLGPDREDDAGNLWRSGELLPGTDVGFRLWDPEQRRQPPPELEELPPEIDELFRPEFGDR